MAKSEALRRWRSALVVVGGALALPACYVVPATGPDGTVNYGYYPLPPPGTPMPTPPAGTVSPGTPATVSPATLTVRLYPANERATKTGVVSGTVANMMSGKGRFVVNYEGEVLSGEATRVSNDDKRGVASAFSSGGMYMSCEYHMNTPYQGTGTCSFANGAKYQMHIGN
ncbi:MAG: hypothetical protein RKP46_06195 [Candidatus Accumulibacter sp.]|uniref:hypothetical protein n=1 Tax=Accumulibacter sp. TaxID=2053492 RepID=UPI002878EBD3|nr:hypothetical protein [Accumulibacter sp.]MDS4013934.1 hypothetical protein [Accumulibacter sp.]